MSDFEKKPAKATNSEIVKALIVLTQDFFDHNPDKPIVDNQVEYGIHVDESNLVERISIALNSYRRQRDRMADLMNQMQRIVSGE